MSLISWILCSDALWSLQLDQTSRRLYCLVCVSLLRACLRACLTNWENCVQIPTIGFLYIAGWIGYVGRQYLNIVKAEKKPTEKEIIIDVPLALRLSLQGAAWPLKAVRELQQGSLVERAENITVRPTSMSLQTQVLMTRTAQGLCS